jgi:predicted DNA-binding transcriptional regulator YafY
VKALKLERLLAIIMMLLNRKQMNAKELADYFEVSQRTIYRDIDAINQAGIPIVSYMGAEGGFGILEGYKLKENFFDDSEINSLIAVLKNLNNTVNNKKISLTMEKLETLKADKKADHSNDNAIRINIDYNNWNSNNKDKEKLKSINKAIYEKRIICFNYINVKGEDTHRIVEPLSLLLKDFSWYLQGYCRSKEDYRLFKVRRMRMVKVTEDYFTRNAPPLEALDYSEEWYKDKTVIDTILKFKVEAKTRVIDSFSEDQIHFLEDNTIEVHFKAPKDNWLVELILGFGSQVEVIEPPELRSLILLRATEICNLYKNDK